MINKSLFGLLAVSSQSVARKADRMDLNVSLTVRKLTKNLLTDIAIKSKKSPSAAHHVIDMSLDAFSCSMASLSSN